MNIYKKSFAVLIAALAFVSGAAAGEDPAGPVLTVLYDNYAFADGCAADWGFSALIEGLEKTILFDSGTRESVFLKNVEALKIDFAFVDLVFISHDHGDHTGGLPAFLKVRPAVPVYIPAGANERFQASVAANGGRVVAVKEPATLFPGVYSTGDVGEAFHEQALVIDAPDGLVVVTGCAHPGIVRILEKAREVWKKDIAMVLGGFHLVQTPPAEVEKIIARFKEMGIKRVGATHCTGDASIAQFRKAFGSGFVEMGVGRKIDLR